MEAGTAAWKAALRVHLGAASIHRLAEGQGAVVGEELEERHDQEHAGVIGEAGAELVAPVGVLADGGRGLFADGEHLRAEAFQLGQQLQLQIAVAVGKEDGDQGGGADGDLGPWRSSWEW